MICVYKGSGPMDAVMLHHWFQRAGIPSVLRGHLQGLGGEIPVGEAWPSVWVNREDEARAQVAIRDFNAPQLVHPRWECADCGEDNEPNFGQCWNCSAEHPSLRR